MAFVCTMITGNESFGGYISMDGNASAKIEHDMTYEIASGRHHFEIFSKSGASRGGGKILSAIGNMGDSNDIFSKMNRHDGDKMQGDSWCFDVNLNDNDCLLITINSKGDQILGDPGYEVTELDAETCENLRKQFEEIRNTPTRSKKMMIGGGITAGIGVFGLFNFIIALLGQPETTSITDSLVFIALIIIGGLIFFFGSKKKIR